MRSLLAKSSVTILIMLALGSGLTLAATSSKPGMFLYPIKQTTQKFTGVTGSPAKPMTPVVGADLEVGPQNEVSHEGVPAGGDQQPSANVHSPSEVIQIDGAQGPDITDAGRASETTATPAPTPVRVVDEITVNTQPDAATGGGSQTIDNTSGPPDIEQLGSGYVDDSSHNDNGQAEESKVGNLGEGRSGKKEKSTDNDNNSGHSDSEHDNESNNNREDHDE